ncbi:hypothetical protein L1987_23964 [Smallanthus sonchifolius]|uniref:Uncharacterized protein n=1 Tax=Smallanthus sonchifolius TaxID=185202 RepID=A0ACB9IKF2_9ASTR|nr:hypothetical protein L1987_23964 [Smallanthus sonchifolius]
MSRAWNKKGHKPAYEHVHGADINDVDVEDEEEEHVEDMPSAVDAGKVRVPEKTKESSSGSRGGSGGEGKVGADGSGKAVIDLSYELDSHYGWLKTVVQEEAKMAHEKSQVAGGSKGKSIMPLCPGLLGTRREIRDPPPWAKIRLLQRQIPLRGTLKSLFA